MKNEVKTGLLVIAGIALFIFGYSYLKSNDLFVSDRTFYAVYDDVEGVVNGTPVTVNGFPVGSITDISFFKKNTLLVKFRVENDIKFSINSLAQIYETGLIGGKALAIIPAMDNSRIAVSRDTLKSSIAPGLTDLVNEKLTPLQENIEMMIVSANNVLEKINSVFDDPTRSNLRTSVSDFSETISDFKKGKFEYKADKAGVVHISFGKSDFTAVQLNENLTALYQSIEQNRPSGVKGKYFKKMFICTSMGPSIQLDLDIFG